MAVADSLERISSLLKRRLEEVGLEAYPFKIVWYNERVSEVHRLPYPPNTLAWIIVSIPCMFDKLFKPYLVNEWSKDRPNDPLHQCFRDYFSKLKKEVFAKDEIDVIHDFEIHPSRRPKILIQTAGHVTGAAYYYQRSDVDTESDPWPKSKKVYGISMHPRYGGWFALRAVLIFRNTEVPLLQQVSPPDCVPSSDMRVKLLEALNEHWQDWKYREISSLPILDRYSEEQKLYFGTLPKDRTPVIERIIEDYNKTRSTT